MAGLNNFTFYYSIHPPQILLLAQTHVDAESFQPTTQQKHAQHNTQQHKIEYRTQLI